MTKLTDLRHNFGNMSLDQLADALSEIGIGVQNEQVVRAEFLRRQTLAIEETAKHTCRNAAYMLASVVVLAVASVASLIVTWFHHSN